MSERTKNPRESRSFVRLELDKWKLISIEPVHAYGAPVALTAWSKEGKETPLYPYPTPPYSGVSLNIIQPSVGRTATFPERNLHHFTSLNTP